MGDVTASHHSSARYFTSVMYVVGGLFAIAVAVASHSLDGFISSAWFDWSLVSPDVPDALFGVTPVTVACAAAGLALFLAAGLSLRWPRAAAALAGAAWLAGMLSPLLLPRWQDARGLAGTWVSAPFIGVWLVAAVPVCVAIRYGLLSSRRGSDVASA
jgi:hypothetical protein